MAIVAFKGDAAVKAAALADAGMARHAGWSIIANDEERAACGDTFGLALSFVNLLSVAFKVPHGDASQKKLQRALSLVATGVDTNALVQRWALSLWNHKEHGIQQKLENTSPHGPAKEIIRLVEISAGAPVARDAWRQARSDLNRAAAQSPEMAPYTDVIAAMAWDLNTTPRATTDIWNAWSYLPKAVSDVAAGWTKDKEDEVLEELRRVMTLAYGELGAEPDGTEAAAAYKERHKNFMDARMVESGYAKPLADWLTHADGIRPRLFSWWEFAETQLFEACAG